MQIRSFVVVAMLAGLVPASAGAQLFRAYVSSKGSDANPCTLPQPCRLLPAALNAVASGGEIWMLDSANYNTSTVNIDRSVAIMAIPGVVGSVVSTASGPAISITTPVQVALRNIAVVPLSGTTNNGLLVTSAATVSLEGCVVSGQGDTAISAGSGAIVSVTRSVFRNNGRGAQAVGGELQVSSSTFVDNGSAVLAFGSGSSVGSVTVSDTTFMGNDAAVQAAALGGSAQISLTRVVIQKSANAMIVYANSGFFGRITIGSSTVTSNTSAFLVNTGGGGTVTIRTLGNNHFADNGGSSGALTPFSAQ